MVELREALSELQKPDDKNPLLLKPSIYGVGIDLPKAWKWLKTWKKVPSKPLQRTTFDGRGAQALTLLLVVTSFENLESSRPRIC